MTVPCKILYSWPSGQGSSISQFILLYNLLQLNILWVNSSPGLRFYRRVLIMLTQMGHGFHPFKGLNKMKLCEGRRGWFMYALVVGYAPARCFSILSGHNSTCSLLIAANDMSFLNKVSINEKENMTIKHPPCNKSCTNVHLERLRKAWMEMYASFNSIH